MDNLLAEGKTKPMINGAPAAAAPLPRFLTSTHLYNSVKGFKEALDKGGIKYAYYESPGTAHEWQTWRRDLAQFAPLLFR